MFLSISKKVTGVWNSEVGSRKSMEKAEDIQFHPWNTTYIFTAVKIQLFIFSRLWNTAFLKYALYLINIFLYFITLYIINTYMSVFCRKFYNMCIFRVLTEIPQHRHRPCLQNQTSRLESIIIKYFISQPKHVVGTQKNSLNEMVLLSTQNKCLN